MRATRPASAEIRVDRTSMRATTRCYVAATSRPSLHVIPRTASSSARLIRVEPSNVKVTGGGSPPSPMPSCRKRSRTRNLRSPSPARRITQPPRNRPKSNQNPPRRHLRRLRDLKPPLCGCPGRWGVHPAYKTWRFRQRAEAPQGRIAAPLHRGASRARMLYSSCTAPPT